MMNEQIQLLKDPNKTRVVKSLPLPPHKPIQSNLIFVNGKVNWQLIRSFLKRQGKVKIQDFIQIIKMATNIFKNQPNLIYIHDPVTIVGDIHGQFYDFLKLLEQQIGGPPNTTQYLFLGDYVDRGSFSIQVLILILSLKISFPQKMYMLRGNHQCRQLTSYFNFRAQCLHKYNQDVYEMVMDLFDTLPLSCLVNNRFLCVHGGISHELRSLQDIKKINRFREIPRTGILCDLMWADPVDSSSGLTKTLIQPNDARGCSYYFGYELTKNFMDRNKIISLIRAHQAQPQGFKMYKWGGNEKMPTVITIFSAPNYCDFYNNKAAVIKFENSTLNIQQFTKNPHPYLLPNFIDLFEWSIPFMAEKISEMLYHILKPHEKIDPQQEIPIELIDKRNIIESVLKVRREQAENNIQLVKLDGNCPDERLLETGKYQGGRKQSFQCKKVIDSGNQHRPQTKQEQN